MRLYNKQKKWKNKRFRKLFLAVTKKVLTKLNLTQNIADFSAKPQRNAKKKRETENSFLDAVKEAAIDCVLYKNHNMINSKYKCFQFSENSLFDKYIGPAYRRNIQEDNMFDNGSNSSKFQTLTIKVKKIKAVKIISIEPVRYSLPDTYLFHKKTSMVYDVDMHYPVGKIKLNENGDPEIYKENIYVINKVIPIPIIEN